MVERLRHRGRGRLVPGMLVGVRTDHHLPNEYCRVFGVFEQRVGEAPVLRKLLAVHGGAAEPLVRLLERGNFALQLGGGLGRPGRLLEAGQADDVRVDGGGRRHAHGEVELLVDALHQRDKRPELGVLYEQHVRFSDGATMYRQLYSNSEARDGRA